MSPPRFHLALTVAGRPVMHGWWSKRSTADRKFREWIGEQGSTPGARVTIVDEASGDVLEAWPDED